MNKTTKNQRPSILAAIGNTPMVKLDFPAEVSIYAKLEHLNPGGSIKDRSALYMIEHAEQQGLLKPGYTIIEGSSGNQGIAVAMIGAIKGYKVIITVPERTSSEKVSTLKAYGAEVLVCKEHDSDQGYTEVAKKLHRENPQSFMLNQYYNTLNIEAHYKSTGPEIWEQTEGKLTHIILALGSCGTAMGVSRYLKEKNSAIKVIGVDAATSMLSSPNPTPYQAEGIGVDSLDGLFDKRYVDEVIGVYDDDIFEMTRRLAREHGLLVGISSGAVMQAALSYAKKLTQDDYLVVIFADSGRAYLQKVFGV
ncbi:MAG: cysteine synthase family protein [Gammaproteobacteria bacterium]|nr:cysteine synthase family protein [Gammaproteobacteria bacterium]